MLYSAWEPKKFSDRRVCIAINGNAEEQSLKLCTTFITGISEQFGELFSFHWKFSLAYRTRANKGRAFYSKIIFWIYAWWYISLKIFNFLLSHDK